MALNNVSVTYAKVTHSCPYKIIKFSLAVKQSPIKTFAQVIVIANHLIKNRFLAESDESYGHQWVL